jgi:UDP-N-acetylmuramoylalanine--D-glutamate ligase
MHGKRVLVVGLARTGVAVSLFSVSRGAHVTGVDARPESEMQEMPALLRAAGVRVEFGAKAEETSLEQDLIVVSPGVPVKIPSRIGARARDSRVE